jgi:DNA-binding transcriptional regulator YhcF (GntR family)
MPASTPTPAHRPALFAQTELATHEAWSRLGVRKPKAAALLHLLVSRMSHQNAVVISQKTLAKLMGCSLDTIQRATAELVKDRWIQAVRVNGPGSVLAHVINSRVAWTDKRENLRLAAFTAEVVADAEDQPETTLSTAELRRIPVLFPGEQQLPTGDGEPPPSEPALPGLEPDLPVIGSAQ